MKNSLVSLLALLVAFAANGQNTSVQPKFEVASVKRTDRCGGGGSINPGSVALRGVPLKAVLMEAFKVKMEQIEGPSWLEEDCFDISARIPEGAGRDQVPAMLQALVTERFRLLAHKVDRLRSGYALVVDKGGPKFKEDDPNTNFMGREKGMMMYSSAGTPFGALKGVMSMATLAANLSTKGYGPVQDLTGLTGKYDIDLRWASSPDVEPKAVTPPTGDSPARSEADLLTALRESLGLKLERRNVQVQFVVIDHIERIPTEN
jgi:uncharacterized protein (TIGR03435 family)